MLKRLIEVALSLKEVSEKASIRCLCHSRLSVLMATSAVALLSGCATQYNPMGWTGGYDDFRITEDTFEVTFRGNGHTAAETVSRYVFRRASEVTLLHGFTHFVPLVETDQTRSYVYGSGGDVHTTVKPRLTMRIRCFQNPLSHADGLIEARQFLDHNFPDAITDLEQLQGDEKSEGDSSRK